MSPDLWVVIVNWNQKDLTAACIASLLRSDLPELRMVVVDNGSSDDSVPFLRNAFPGVEMICNESNLGFSGGNNVGIRHAMSRRARLVWLLNNDTEVAADCARRLLAEAERQPDVGVFACKIYYAQPSNRLWYGGGEVRLLRPMGVVHTGYNRPDGVLYDKEKEVSFVTGCSLVMRASVLASVGLLDEELFIYAEDLDWCIRARRAGFRAMYVPNARVWHKVSRSFSSPQGQELQAYLYTRNRFIVQRRYLHWPGLLWLISTYPFGGLGRSAIVAAVKGRLNPLRRILQGAFDGILGRQRRYPVSSGVPQSRPSRQPT